MSTTEKVKHTPGPWTLTEHSGKYTPRHIIRSKNAAIIEFASFGSVGIEQREANARLIAAAPELLEALEQAHTLIGELLIDNVLGEDVIPVHDAMMAAIRKAKGE